MAEYMFESQAHATAGLGRKWFRVKENNHNEFLDFV